MCGSELKLEFDGVNRQTTEDYAGTKQGVDIIVSSITPIMGLAVANKVSSLGLGAVKAQPSKNPIQLVR